MDELVDDISFFVDNISDFIAEISDFVDEISFFIEDIDELVEDISFLVFIIYMFFLPPCSKMNYIQIYLHKLVYTNLSYLSQIMFIFLIIF